MHGRIFIIVLILLAGCSKRPTPTLNEHEAQEVTLANEFDPASTGALRGRVVWDGTIPRGEEVVLQAMAFNPNLHKNPARFVLPHYPQVDAKGRGIANAVVFLYGIEPHRSKPWDHASVRVEFQDRRLTIQQGEQRSAVGFVRRGGAVEVVNRDQECHILRGRGTAFLSMPLVEANSVQPLTLSQSGLVDLTCSAGYYWLNAHLFVAEHPYYTRTDAEGRFVLDRIPAGTYTLVCWMPSWIVERHERDPASGTIARVQWKPPVEQECSVEVKNDRTHEIDFHWSSAAFHVGKR